MTFRIPALARFAMLAVAVVVATGCGGGPKNAPPPATVPAAPGKVTGASNNPGPGTGSNKNGLSTPPGGKQD